MDSSILNVRDRIQNILYIKTQLRVAEEFAPFTFIGEDTHHLTIYKEENFLKIVEAYELDASDIHVEDKVDCVKKWINVRDFEINVYIHKEEKNDDADE